MIKIESVNWLVVPVGDIKIHESISVELKELLAVVDFNLRENNYLSSEALHLLSILHPVVCVRQRGGKTLCIAGLRTLQLIKSRVDHEEKIRVLILKKLHKNDLPTLAAFDIYLYTLVYGLDPHLFNIGLVQIINAIGYDLIKKITPKITSKMNMANILGIDRRRLSPSNSEVVSISRKLLAIGIEDGE